MPGRARAQVSRYMNVPVSDCQYPRLTASSGTQRARSLRSPTIVGSSAHWCSSLPSELRITRVSPCVARRFKTRPSFMFAGGCRWRWLTIDGSSGTSRGHGSVMRRSGSRRDGAVERPSVFHQAGHIPSWRGSCERYALSAVAAGRRWLLLLSAEIPQTPPGFQRRPTCWHRCEIGSGAHS